MNILIKYFVLLKLVTEICSVNAYTVFLKPVLPLYQAIRVYKYDVRHPKIFKEPTAQYIQHSPISVQRIYPVYVKHHQSQNFRTVFPIKKEKRKYKIKVSSTTEKPLPREQKLHDLQQELVPPLSNQLEEYTESKEEELTSDGDVSLSVPGFFDGERFPSFGQEKGRPYTKPGEWATRQPSADSDNSTESNFTPSQLYLQVRHKNTVIHVPQSEALKDAETLEELINAPRLKELARITHVQEMYSEEGYEDAGYDHAGHIRHAQHGEVYDAKDEGKFSIKDPPIILDYDSDGEESENMHNPRFASNESESVQKNSYEKPLQNKTDVGNTSAVVTTPVPGFFRKEHTYTSSVKQPLKIDTFIRNTHINSTDDKVKNPIPTMPVYLTKRSQVSTENASVKVPNNYLKPPPPKNFSSKYRQRDMNSTKIYKIESTAAPQISNFTDLDLPIDSEPSSSAKSLKYSRIYSKKTKHLRLEPFKSGTIYKPILYDSTHLSVPTDKPTSEGAANQKIVLPTIGYINSLTTAHFAKGSSPPPTDESKAQLTIPLNLTQALNYLRSNKKEKPENKQESVKAESLETSRELGISFFEPKRLKITKVNTKNYGKTKRDVFLMGEQSNITNNENYEGKDESDLPHDEKNKEIEEDEKNRTAAENVEKDKYEKDLRDEITDVEKKVLKETYKNIGVEGDISEVFPELPSSSSEDEEFVSLSDLKSKEKLINPKKYPFYFSKSLPENSPLRYMTSPFEFPKKSGHKMEFYESREKLIQCPEFHPPLDEVPPQGSDPQRGDNHRLLNVGDKIACLKAKYFDVDPFDSPFFKEKDIDYVGKPKKLKKALMSSSSKPKSKPVFPQPLQKQITNFGSQQNIKITTPHHLDGANSQDENLQIKYLENKRPETTKQTEEIAVSSRLKYFHEDKKEIGKSPFPGEVIPSVETTKNPLLHEQPSSTYRVPHAEAFTAPQSGNFENLQPLSNVKIVLPRNCVPAINKMTAQGGTKNIVMDCSNFGFFENASNKSEIIPANQSRDKNFTTRNYSYQTDWVPIVGYTLPKNVSNSIVALDTRRKADNVSNATKETTQNIDSDHYVIDELVEDENVRKGEVVDDMDHYYKLLNETKPEAPDITESKEEMLKISNNTRGKREAGFDVINLDKSSTQQPIQADLVNVTDSFKISRPFKTKATLTRLSGKDFLNRYHSKNRKKGLENNNSSDFWKISTSSPTITESPESNTNKKKAEAEKPKEESKEKKAKQLNTKGKDIEETYNLKIDKKIQQIQKTVPKSSEKNTRKLEVKQTNEFRKVPLLNLIPEKITTKQNRLESKPNFENDRISTHSPSVKINSTKESKIVILTKVTTAISETTEKYKTIRRKNEETTATEIPKNNENDERRPDDTKPSSNFETYKKTGKERSNQYIEGSDGPILYYIVDERTGKGKWISSHGKRRRFSKNSEKEEESSKHGNKVKSTKGRNMKT